MLQLYLIGHFRHAEHLKGIASSRHTSLQCHMKTD